MKDKLQDYVLTIPNVLTDNLCKKIIKELENSNWENQNFYSHREKTYDPDNTSDSDTTFDQISSNQDIKDGVWKTVHKYILEEFNFSWFVGWEGFSRLKFNRYHKNKLMREHCDHISSIFDGEKRGIPTLSIIGSLNNNYEGGELIMFQDKEYNIRAGEILIFPSNFLYPHKVMPVTKGTRYTYVSWVY